MTFELAALAALATSIALSSRAPHGDAPPVLLAPAAPTASAGSLLSSVPEDAYALLHCRDFAALRARAEQNDWYRLLGSPHGDPFLREFGHEFHSQTHTEMDALLSMAAGFEGEAVFFASEAVAGFMTAPPADPTELVGLMREWMPKDAGAGWETLELEGGTVELVAWPDDLGAWDGRAGHYAAFVVHPLVLAIYSGDDSASVLSALTDGLAGLGAERRAPLVSSYLEAGGGASSGVELFLDFTPFVDQAEAAMEDALYGLFPDPTRLLGLEDGTWLHASADVYPGTAIDCRARLHLPPNSLLSHLADTFAPLPSELSSELPEDIWGIWSLNWDFAEFYRRVRAAYLEAGHEEGFEAIDMALETARGMADVDPIDDMLNQFQGDFSVYVVDAEDATSLRGTSADDPWLCLGFQAGLHDGDAFLTAFEKLFDAVGGEGFMELDELAGVDAYLIVDDEFDGGIAFLEDAFAVAATQRVLEQALRGLSGTTDASSRSSRAGALIDENAGACFLYGVEMTPLRVYFLPELNDDLRLPPLVEGQPARDPFDSQFVATAWRTPEGFDFRIHTR